MTIFSNKELAQKLENTVALNKIEFVSTQNKLSNDNLSSFKKVDSGYAIYAKSFPSLTLALGLGLKDKVQEDEIIQLEEFFKEKNSPVKIDISCLVVEECSLMKIMYFLWEQVLYLNIEI